MNHAQVRIRNTLLLHWLLFKRSDEVLESLGSILLIVHSLFRLKIANYTADIMFVTVLVVVVL